MYVIQGEHKEREIGEKEMAGKEGHIETYIFGVQLCLSYDRVITQPSVANTKSQRQGHTKCSKSKVLLLSYSMFYSISILRY